MTRCDEHDVDIVVVEYGVFAGRCGVTETELALRVHAESDAMVATVASSMRSSCSRWGSSIEVA